MTTNTVERDALIQEVAEKVRALGGSGVTPEQEQYIKDHVAREFEARGDAKPQRAEPRPDESSLLDGTVWKRLGLGIGDVELAHDLMVAAAAKDTRAKGPNESTRRLVEAARKARDRKSVG